jgi:predicted nucleic acid-binding protein
VQATRTGRKDRLTHGQAALLVESWLRFPVQETTVGVLKSALETRRRHRLSHWDAAVVAAARSLGARFS